MKPFQSNEFRSLDSLLSSGDFDEMAEEDERCHEREGVKVDRLDPRMTVSRTVSGVSITTSGTCGTCPECGTCKAEYDKHSSSGGDDSPRDVFRRGKVLYGIYLPSISGRNFNKREAVNHILIQVRNFSKDKSMIF